MYPAVHPGGLPRHTSYNPHRMLVSSRPASSSGATDGSGQRAGFWLSNQDSRRLDWNDREKRSTRRDCVHLDSGKLAPISGVKADQIPIREQVQAITVRASHQILDSLLYVQPTDGSVATSRDGIHSHCFDAISEIQLL